MYSTEMEKSEESFSPSSKNSSHQHNQQQPPPPPPFPSYQVGTYSCHGIEPHPYIVYTKNEKPLDLNAMSFFDRMFGTNASEKYTSAKVVTISQRKINQDRGHIIYPFGISSSTSSTNSTNTAVDTNSDNKNEHMALFGVFDGHGICGDMLAEYTMNAVYEKLNSHPHLHMNKYNTANYDDDDDDGSSRNRNNSSENNNNDNNIKEAFRDVFREIDNEVKDKVHLKPAHSGSTACVVLLHENKVWAANIGDSRVVAARRSSSSSSNSNNNNKSAEKVKAIEWSKDQNANDKNERLRVLQSGGYVSLPQEEGLPARIWLDKDCTQIGLAMSRSIGDYALKDVGVISDPVVEEYQISDDDEFFIIATDGVWEFITSKDAVEIIQGCFDQGMGASDACEILIKEAMERWKEKEGDYRDDITAIIVKLKGLWD